MTARCSTQDARDGLLAGDKLVSVFQRKQRMREFLDAYDERAASQKPKGELGAKNMGILKEVLQTTPSSQVQGMSDRSPNYFASSGRPSPSLSESSQISFTTATQQLQATPSSTSQPSNYSPFAQVQLRTPKMSDPGHMRFPWDPEPAGKLTAGGGYSQYNQYNQYNHTMQGFHPSARYSTSSIGLDFAGVASMQPTSCRSLSSGSSGDSCRTISAFLPAVMGPGRGMVSQAGSRQAAAGAAGELGGGSSRRNSAVYDVGVCDMSSGRSLPGPLRLPSLEPAVGQRYSALLMAKYTLRVEVSEEPLPCELCQALVEVGGVVRM
eukprot:CAMPEP_0202899262 /NCGR_PEP_ID=MMETSP1392-20130828/7545_1 /ASSEMBLY_ACC=CAM_ASM_000868 /TAXON_ID=225041 /ORGANISM="Chlamydomonas chlamydogama, Strain SAG 11-48b" /LENGTH=322 /DNA_ID=CAMNT_0049585395 /DNA_START=98 /DNA_END=1063 /DNA_ORIENTATION=+